MEINRKISLFFKEAGVSRKEIAEDNEVNESTVSQWFTGKRAMPLSLLVYAVQHHNLDANSLFEKELPTTVSENRGSYENKSAQVESLLKDIEKVLKKHL